ncbi:hypothetical protein DIPPA_08089 [Diplonema papillatum]|nr:hypothetical protein DIPPA_08089 [Diplonema papillatum]
MEVPSEARRAEEPASTGGTKSEKARDAKKQVDTDSREGDEKPTGKPASTRGKTAEAGKATNQGSSDKKTETRKAKTTSQHTERPVNSKSADAKKAADAGKERKQNKKNSKQNETAKKPRKKAWWRIAASASDRYDSLWCCLLPEKTDRVERAAAGDPAPGIDATPDAASDPPEDLCTVQSSAENPDEAPKEHWFKLSYWDTLWEFEKTSVAPGEYHMWYEEWKRGRLVGKSLRRLVNVPEGDFWDCFAFFGFRPVCIHEHLVRTADYLVREAHGAKELGPWLAASIQAEKTPAIRTAVVAQVAGVLAELELEPCVTVRALQVIYRRASIAPCLGTPALRRLFGWYVAKAAQLRTGDLPFGADFPHVFLLPVYKPRGVRLSSRVQREELLQDLGCAEQSPEFFSIEGCSRGLIGALAEKDAFLVPILLLAAPDAVFSLYQEDPEGDWLCADAKRLAVCIPRGLPPEICVLEKEDEPCWLSFVFRLLEVASVESAVRDNPKLYGEIWGLYFAEFYGAEHLRPRAVGMLLRHESRLQDLAVKLLSDVPRDVQMQAIYDEQLSSSLTKRQLQFSVLDLFSLVSSHRGASWAGCPEFVCKFIPAARPEFVLKAASYYDDLPGIAHAVRRFVETIVSRAVAGTDLRGPWDLICAVLHLHAKVCTGVTDVPPCWVDELDRSEEFRARTHAEPPAPIEAEMAGLGEALDTAAFAVQAVYGARVSEWLSGDAGFSGFDEATAKWVFSRFSELPFRWETVLDRRVSELPFRWETVLDRRGGWVEARATLERVREQYMALVELVPEWRPHERDTVNKQLRTSRTVIDQGYSRNEIESCLHLQRLKNAVGNTCPANPEIPA